MKERKQDEKQATDSYPVEEWEKAGKEDHFEEVEYIDKCMICRNRNSQLCGACKHN